EHHGEHHHHDAEPQRAAEGRPDVNDAEALPQLGEPVQRYPVERKREAALRPLKREDDDGDHRAVEEQHEQPEQEREPVERGGPGLAHVHSSLRMSTSRVSAQMMNSTASSRMTEL